MARSPSPSDLTPRKRDVLRVIREFTAAYGYPPSIRQAGRAMDLRSASTIYRHIERLERRGYIRRPIPRILLLTPLGMDALDAEIAPVVA